MSESVDVDSKQPGGDAQRAMSRLPEIDAWIDRIVVGLKRAEIDKEYREQLGERVS